MNYAQPKPNRKKFQAVADVDDTDCRSASAEAGIRFQDDMELRNAGYEIASRPKVGEVMWRRGKYGVARGEREVLVEIAARAVRLKRGEMNGVGGVNVDADGALPDA